MASQQSHTPPEVFPSLVNSQLARHLFAFVRATDVTLALGKPKDISARTMLKGTIFKCEIDTGPIAIVHVKLEGGEELSAALTRKARDQLGLDEGQAVWCLLKSVSIDERWMPSA